MKVFVCAFGGFYVAIPMGAVASLADLADRRVMRPGGAVVRDEESADIHVSLPMLFELPLEKPRHGIVLKNPEEGEGGGRVVLLSTEVVNADEIPDEKIHPIPKSLNGTRFSWLFRGMRCATGTARDAGLVVLLDTERLIDHARREVIE